MKTIETVVPDGARDIERALDEALRESFPASDPIAVSKKKWPQNCFGTVRRGEKSGIVTIFDSKNSLKSMWY